MDYATTEEMILKVKDLDQVGISAEAVSASYLSLKSRTLNLNELIKVSHSDEGKDIEFKTFDKIIIRVPIELASGGYNKILN